jgi:hypothetical protein
MSVDNLINTLPEDLTNLVITPRAGTLSEEFIETTTPETSSNVGTIFVSDGSGGLIQNSLYYRPQLNATPIELSSNVSPFDPRFSVQNRLMVKKNPGMGEFLTVSAALASLTIPPLPSTTNRYMIWIGPGTYTEPQLTVPPFVYLVGMEQNAVILAPSILNLPFITFQANSGASFFSINGSNSAGFVAVDVLNNAEFTLFHKLTIFNSNIGIRIRTTAASIDSETYLEYIDINDSAFRAIQVTSTAGGTQSNFVTMEDFFVFANSVTAPIQAEISGAGSTFDTIGAEFIGLGAGIALEITNGSTIRLTATSIEGFTTAINNPNSGAGSQIFVSNSYYNDNTTNINIQNPATTGYGDGYSEYVKTLITNTSTFFITEKQKQTITVSKSSGDFNDIAAAIASIGVITPAASPTFVYIIIVYPGIYTNLATITLPQWVTIRGISRNTVTIVGPGVAGPTIEGAPNSSVEQVTISNPSGTCIQYQGDPGGLGIFSTLNIRYDNCSRFFTGNNNNGMAIVFNLGVVVAQSFLTFEGFILTNCQFYIETAFLQVIGGALTDMFRISGALSNVGINNSTIRVVVGAPFGTFCRITNSARVRINNLVADGLVTGLTVPLDATSPILNIVDVTFTNCTTDISIANPNCTGNIYVVADRDKVTITPSISNISVIIQDPTPADASFSFNGRFFYGETYPNITNMTARLVECGPTGLVEGGVPSVTSGLNIQVAAGKGYVMRGALPNEHPTFMEWLVTLGPITLAPNVNNFIYIDQLGVLTSAVVRPDPYLNIFIAEAITDASSVLFLVSDSMFIKNVASRTIENLNLGLSVVYKSGSQGAIVAPNQVNITGGMFYYGSSPVFTPAGQSPATLYRIFSNITPSDIKLDAITTLVPTTTYNDLATGIVAIPAGQFTAHTIFAAYNSDTSTTRYFMRYGQNVFATQTQAEGYTVGSGFTSTIPPIFSVVVSQAAAAIVSIIDRRPYLSTVNSASQPVVLQHSALLGLTVGNDHPQYLLRDGTQPMTGALNMGSNNVTSAGTYNGVTVEAHASRHVPGGADPLPTAAPVTIGTVNAIGSAASFARSDHVHAHGNQTSGTLHAVATTLVAGFMSAADKAFLSSATESNIAKTLMLRGNTMETDITQINYMTNLNLNMVSMRAPAAIGADWTMTLPPNPGTAGFALITDGSGVTNWSGALPPDPMTTPYDIIYRNAANVTSRLPVGTFGQGLRSMNTAYTSSGGVPAPALIYETIPAAPCREYNFFDDFSGGNALTSSTTNFDCLWNISVGNGGSFTAIGNVTIPSTQTVATQADAVGCIGFNSSTATNSFVSWNKGSTIMSCLYGVLELEIGFYLHQFQTPVGTNVFIARLGTGNTTGSIAPTNGIYLLIKSGAGQVFTLFTIAGGSSSSTNTVMQTEDNAYYVVNIVTNVAATTITMTIVKITNGGVRTSETIVFTPVGGIPNTTTTLFGPYISHIKTAGTSASSNGFIIDFYRLKMSFTRRGRI